MGSQTLAEVPQFPPCLTLFKPAPIGCSRKNIMFSRRHVAPGYEPYRFSATRTLSDFPLLIGELLRRGERICCI
jgi:hypothetical protein